MPRCHTEVRTDVLAGVGFHGRHPDSEDAGLLHVPRRARRPRRRHRRAAISSAFAHIHTDFPLLGAHEKLTCAGCHAADTEFRDAPRTCCGCHAGDDVHEGALVADVRRLPSADGVAQHVVRSQPTFPARRASTQRRRAPAVTRTDRSRRRRPNAPLATARTTLTRGRNGAQCGSCHNAVAWSRDELRPSRVRGLRAARQPPALGLRVVSRDESRRGAAVDCAKAVIAATIRTAARSARNAAIATTRRSGARRASITRARQRLRACGRARRDRVRELPHGRRRSEL